ncbi:serine/threonine-protein kinase DCLK1 [Platysternon megacephalum]|uniref:Serine/threonine-protein kinase DCLK1 n=1 Tax=Platysternon megacephalum TaxID=55544 RepID=A0A4D9EI50_9SAUR|nr:serine/threonine-protein kinase DCLK1 [Platysternon megacephalum]
MCGRWVSAEPLSFPGGQGLAALRPSPALCGATSLFGDPDRLGGVGSRAALGDGGGGRAASTLDPVGLAPSARSGPTCLGFDAGGPGSWSWGRGGGCPGQE